MNKIIQKVLLTMKEDKQTVHVHILLPHFPLNEALHIAFLNIGMYEISI